MAEKINIALQERMERYLNGGLSEQEIDELWAELITSDYYLDYLYTLANLRALFQAKQVKKEKPLALLSDEESLKIKT